MNINEYENLPDGMMKSEVEDVFYIWLEESKSDSLNVALKKLDILADHQWHTYELPSKDVENKICQWLDNNYTTDEVFLEIALGVCYCFGLSKNLYRRLLNLYHGESKSEFVSNLESSYKYDNNIDPYWSMREWN